MMGKGWGRAVVVAVGALASTLSCGGTVTENGHATDGAGGASAGDAGAGDGGAGGTAGSGGARGLPVSGAGGSNFEVGGAPGTGGGECRADAAFAVEPLPVDLLLMFDQSSSMGELVPATEETWWSAATEAVRELVDNPVTAGVGIGIQYFPFDGTAPTSCTAPYSTPDVPIGLLPGVAGAIETSLAAHVPTGLTPSGPALQGAIDYMRSYAQPGRGAAVVFVTGGFPTECEPGDVPGVAEIARAGMDGTPAVRTFLVGLNQGLAGLREIAKAGGTEDAVLIDGGNVREQLVSALLSIASTTHRCELGAPPAPPGEHLVLEAVSLRFTPAATNVPEVIPRLQGRGDCDLRENGNAGWYFDDPSNPVRILVCPGTCTRFAAGSVSVAIGCNAGPEPV